MPVGAKKNLLYGLALPMLGLRCRWKTVQRTGDTATDRCQSIARALRRSHAVGGSIQLITDGRLAECYTAGNAAIAPDVSVTPDTFFRTASVAKMACALLVMRLQTLGRLNVSEDISPSGVPPS